MVRGAPFPRPAHRTHVRISRIRLSEKVHAFACGRRLESHLSWSRPNVCSNQGLHRQRGCSLAPLCLASHHLPNRYRTCELMIRSDSPGENLERAKAMHARRRVPLGWPGTRYEGPALDFPLPRNRKADGKSTPGGSFAAPMALAQYNRNNMTKFPLPKMGSFGKCDRLIMPFGTAIDGGAAILTKAVLRWRRVRGTIRDDGTGTTGQGRPGT